MEFLREGLFLMNKFVLFFLILIFIFSTFLRFYDLDKSGIFAFDEGIYFSLVKTMRLPLDYFLEKAKGDIFDMGFSEYIQKKGAYHFMAGKPTYILSAFLVSLLTGLKDYTLPFTSALFGTLTVILVFFIAKGLKGVAAGLISAFILAVSWFHVTYSRSAFPHITGTFFAYLAIYIYYLLTRKDGESSSTKLIFLYGFALGLAIPCHYTLYWIVAIFGVNEAFYLLKGFSRKSKISSRRFFIWAIAVILPVVFWQLATFIIWSFLYSKPAYISMVKGASGTGSFSTYFNQLSTALFSANRQTGYEGNIWFYVKIIAMKEGILFLLVFLAGLAGGFMSLLKRWRGGASLQFIIMLYFLFPFVLFGTYSHFPTTRTFCIALPAMAIIASTPIVWFLKKRFMFFALILLLFLTAGQLVNTLPVLYYRSGFKEAMRYMESHKGIKHLSSNVYVSRAYVDRDKAVDMSFSFRQKEYDPTGKLHVSLDSLKEFVGRNDFRYLLLDQYRFSYPNEIFAAASQVKPVFAVKHATVSFLYDSKKEYQEQILGYPRLIEVYDIEDILKKMDENEKEKDA